jgi:pimeloyl-ACP methyl ester carboxylesterase
MSAPLAGHDERVPSNTASRVESTEAAIDLTDPRRRSRLTPRVRRDVLVDVAILRMMALQIKKPDAATIERVSVELAEALERYEQRGWLSDPAAMHPTPPPMQSVRESAASSGRLRYKELTWLDEFSCEPGEPGGERYAGYTKNKIARATLFEHRNEDRPWLVCIHGFGMGRPALDVRAFRALRFHRELGLNVALPVLPFHGRRGETIGLPPFPGPDLMDNLHAFAQSFWDVRQLLAELRTRTSQPIAVMGLSLGGCVAAMLAALDDDLAAAITLVPLVDFVSMIEGASQLARGDDRPGLELIARAKPLFDLVSPLSLKPKVPLDRRLIVGGTLDKFVNSSTQIVPLWRHWDEPELKWYHGGHVSYFWAKSVLASVDDMLGRAGMV